MEAKITYDPGIRVQVDYEWIIKELRNRLQTEILIHLDQVVHVLRELDREQKENMEKKEKEE